MDCRVALVQHGEKVGVAGDPGLTARGRAAVASCAAVLAQSSWDGLWCSDLRRAIETAQIIGAACRQLPVVDPRLRERLNWERGTFEEFLAEWERSSALSAATAARHLELLDEIAAHCRRALVVAHGGATLDLVRSLGASVDHDSVPPCAVTSLSFGAGGWRVDSVAVPL
jgi:2,3-bisphosphoglycerate-dependent phosphoglycerate mutase